MKSLFVLVLLFVTPVMANAAALTDSTAVLARAHELTPYVSSNAPGPLWTAFDITMRTAMQDSTRFAATLDGIHAQVGAVKKVIKEEVSQERGVWVYRATCEFEN